MCNCFNSLMKMCYLLYIFVAVAIVLLMICVYLYRKFTKQVATENEELNIMYPNTDNIEEIKGLLEDSVVEYEENADGVPPLIRISFENDDKSEKYKEYDKEEENIELDGVIETIEEGEE